MSKYYYRGGVKFVFAKGSIYCNEPMFIDIETSNNHAEDPHDLRTWIVSIQVLFHNEYHLFRYPEELIKYLKSLYYKLYLKPSEKFKKKLIIYIHNLSYDMSYLYPYLLQLPGVEPEADYQGIIEGPNKFLSLVFGSYEFRCSYRLSGMSLEKWSKEMGAEHVKKVGMYDYDKVLYPDSELSEEEQDYDKYDVYSMRDSLNKQMKYFKDDITTIPLTKTGYIRRTLRKSCFNDPHYKKKYFWDTKLSARNYEYCLKSFAGGYTHNNRFWRDTLVEVGKTYEYIPNSGIYIKVDKIKHRDFKSHYPTQQTCSNRFPIGRPQHVYDCSKMPFVYTVEDILKEQYEFTHFIKLLVTDCELRDEYISMPFMQLSKCYQADFQTKICDNGRILKASGSFIMYVDTITLSILAEQYTMECAVLDVYRMKNGPLPSCMVEVVDKYFKGKSDKKALVHELEEAYGSLHPKTIEAEFDLMQEKAGLNSIYGCTVQQPLKDVFQIDKNMEFSFKKKYISESEVEEGLESYYTGKNNFLPYQVGCVVTSLARLELYEFIKLIGYEYVLYSDTDSLFYISTPEIERRIEEKNKELRSNAHYVELKSGKKEYYNEFSEELDCLAFKGLHAKCYGIVQAQHMNKKGELIPPELKITIAGVPARTIIRMEEDKPIYYTREEELSGPEKDPIRALDHLRDNFTFHINAGLCALYIGAEGYGEIRKPEILHIDGHEIHTAGGCVLKKLESKTVIVDPDNKKKKKNYDEEINPDSMR